MRKYCLLLAPGLITGTLLAVSLPASAGAPGEIDKYRATQKRYSGMGYRPTDWFYPPTYMQDGHSYFYYPGFSEDGRTDEPAESADRHLNKYTYPSSRYFRFRWFR